MKGILKKLVLLAIPICLIGFTGCGQNLQNYSEGNLDALKSMAESMEIVVDDGKNIVERNVAEPIISNLPNTEGPGSYPCGDYTTVTGGDGSDPWDLLWKEILEDDVTNSYKYDNTNITYHYDEEVCSGLMVDSLRELRDTYKSWCARGFLSTMCWHCAGVAGCD